VADCCGGCGLVVVVVMAWAVAACRGSDSFVIVVVVVTWCGGRLLQVDSLVGR
jgi:hypothetical protein